ncbi:MAG: leucyl/phenylalanyl-tRNA--protein transferase [Rhodothalassiaceae bacterium]
MAALTPELLLRAYAAGLFPMADDAQSQELFWVDPERRGILPLEAFHIPRRLARTVRTDPFEITIDRDFAEVIAACAAPARGRENTWINDDILSAYTALHEMGHAHSIACRLNGRLVGGLYGVSLGAAFFGESMFHRARDASKIALVHLVARLRAGGYQLLDTQFLTAHLAQFGAIEIRRERYRSLLRTALSQPADFGRLPDGVTGREVLELLKER